MRRLRALRQMAGLVQSGVEKRARREQRRAVRAQRDVDERVQLIDRIVQREQGAGGSKPMPFSQVRERWPFR